MRRMRKTEIHEAEDLDLAPMLDMIVSLLTVLLATFSFYQTAVIDAVVPRPTTKADTKKDKAAYHVFLEMNADRGMRLLVKKQGRVVLQRKMGALAGKLDLARLKNGVKELHRRYPEVSRVEVVPADSLSYQEIIEAVDRVKSPDGGQKRLYKDVVFSNIFRG